MTVNEMIITARYDEAAKQIIVFGAVRPSVCVCAANNWKSAD